MKTAAIIAEYNPFHQGHAYQIAETKKQTGADYILVVMSGDFVQRGAPAIFNKYTRTKMALSGGADVVLELPALYASSSAEFFAQGGVKLLHQLGMVDYLSFGSECGDLSLITAFADLLLARAEDFQRILSGYLKQGLSFPAARYQTVLQFTDDLTVSEEAVKSLFSSPNNILALEYCKALLAFNSPILPFTLKRQGDSYHETRLNQDTSVFSSASAIRTALEADADRIVTKPALLHAYPSEYLTCNDLSAQLHYKLISQTAQGFTDYLDCSSDLSDKIQKNLPAFTDFTGFCDLLKSRDLTYTRISRVLTHILLNITTPDSFRQPFLQRQLSVPYARLLGFRKESTALLSAIKQNSSIPLISKLADAPSLFDLEKEAGSHALQLLSQDIFVSTVYESAFSQKYKKGPSVNEYRQSPVIL